MLPLEGITATPTGWLKLAPAPVPSVEKPPPLPASVVTTPLGVTSRMRLFPASATTKTPLEGITATPIGLRNDAAVPMPSKNVELPLPASVVTAPRGVTSRMRWLSVSATTITPLDGITATPDGLLNLAVVPVPSAEAALPLPASVATTPRGVTRRMQWFPVSATTITPLERITAIAVSSEKREATAVPSTNPGLPLPARVVTTPLFGSGTVAPTTSAAAWGDAPCCASPVAPHSSTAAHVAGAAHLTHALALHATLPPLGSADGAPMPATLR